MEIILFDHNEVAHEQLEKDLETKQLTTLNRATGTGKSFIALKYLYKNRDKRILYLTPTYPIFYQLINKHMKTLGINKNEFRKFDNIIYSNLLKMDMQQLAKEYDIIVLDEYHRAGAKKWGKKLKELIKIIKENYPEKKIIGLTATHKRYLDNERDMTKELFDGNCASTLELAEAIVKGLLPAPLYINTMYNKDEVILNFRKTIENDVFYEKDKEKYIKMLINIQDKLRIANDADNVFKPYLKTENAKYIAFNSKIEDIKENNKKISIWFEQEVTYYEIHSRNSHEKNERILEEFRNAKEGINVLCVVDILNEGIHVSGIDGILMLRKTTSPIIYFQQLGRLLSFSGRNDSLVVWDLVGNINHHNVITDLYKEVQETVKELLKTDPENEERYKKILENFKIIDSTRAIYDDIEKLRKNLNKNDVIETRLNTAIEILNNQIEVTSKEKIQAHIDIFKYSVYVNADMHKRIINLDIHLPEILNVSNEKFIENLNGHKNYKELGVDENLNAVKSLEEEYILFSKLPLVTSNNNVEKLLAKRIVNRTLRFSDTLRNKIKVILDTYDKLTAYDKVYYGKIIEKNEYEEFFKELDKMLGEPKIVNNKIVKYTGNTKYINKNVYNFIYNNAKNGNLFQTYLYKLKVFSKFNFKVDDSEKITICEKVILFAKNNKGRLPEYSNDPEELKLFLEFNALPQELKNKYIGIIESEMYELYDVEDDKVIIEKLEDVTNRLLEFIKENLCFPTPKNNEGLYKVYNGYKDLLDFYGYKEKLEEYLKRLKKDKIEKIVEKLVKELIVFITKNQGYLPSIYVDDKEEIALANRYKKYKRYFNEEQNTLIEQTMLEVQKVSEDIVSLVVEFIKKNKRYPIGTSNNNEEKELAEKFLRFKEVLSPEDNNRLKRAFEDENKKDVLKNTFSMILGKRR